MDERNWKIKMNNFYSQLYAKKGYKAIVKTDFFYEDSPEQVDIKKSLNLLCTPLPIFLGEGKQDEDSSKKCVLLSTGAFAPYHQGHLEMMEVAKRDAEKRGYKVLAGYISPSHDHYIKYKLKDLSDKYNIHYRIERIREKIQQHEWLLIDPWEALFNDVSINFTDVLYRLQSYLNFHINDKNVNKNTSSIVEVLYVCGGDNTKFNNTFKDKNKCIIVPRTAISSTIIREKEGNQSNKLLHKEQMDKLFLKNDFSHELSGEIEKVLMQDFNTIKKSFIEKQKEQFKQNYLDSHINLNIRDFILTAQDSGFMISFYQTKMRVPYLYPYVDITTKGSKPTKEVSIKIWELNKSYAEKYNLKVKDAPSFIALFEYLGFDSDTDLSFVCEYHINTLQSELLNDYSKNLDNVKDFINKTKM